MDQVLLIIEDLRSQSDTPHLAELLWTSDQPVAETSTCQHMTFTRDRHPSPGGILTGTLNKHGDSDPHLKPHGDWDWQLLSRAKFL